MILAPVIAKAASLNHYSDYGVLEQSDTIHNNAVSISDDPFGYSDAYTDNESGLQYLQVRYYNPTIMRFTQMDTYHLLNRYAYANENPIMNDDPSGHTAEGESNTQFKGAGLAGKLVSTSLGLLGGSVTGYIITLVEAGAEVLANPGIGITTLAAAIITTAEGAAASAAQTSITAKINHQKLSVGDVLKSAGIGGGLALTADIIGEGLGYYVSKNFDASQLALNNDIDDDINLFLSRARTSAPPSAKLNNLGLHPIIPESSDIDTSLSFDYFRDCIEDEDRESNRNLNSHPPTPDDENSLDNEKPDLQTRQKEVMPHSSNKAFNNEERTSDYSSNPDNEESTSDYSSDSDTEEGIVDFAEEPSEEYNNS